MAVGFDMGLLGAWEMFDEYFELQFYKKNFWLEKGFAVPGQG